MMSLISAKPRAQAQEGFTLIEILIATALVVIIGAFAIPGIMNMFEKGKRQTAKTQLRNVKNALSTYYADVGQYPESLTDLVKRPEGEEAAKWDGPYLEGKTAPSDPWGTKIQYRKTPEGENPYELYSYGSSKGKSTPKDKWIDVWKA